MEINELDAIEVLALISLGSATLTMLCIISTIWMYFHYKSFIKYQQNMITQRDRYINEIKRSAKELTNVLVGLKVVIGLTKPR